MTDRRSNHLVLVLLGLVTVGCLAGYIVLALDNNPAAAGLDKYILAGLTALATLATTRSTSPGAPVVATTTGGDVVVDPTPAEPVGAAVIVGKP